MVFSILGNLFRRVRKMLFPVPHSHAFETRLQKTTERQNLQAAELRRIAALQASNRVIRREQGN